MMKKSMSIFNKIKVTPLAAESLGVRSMCTLVETPDVKVLLDAGISLCPHRFGLPPHPTEFKTIERLRKRIAKAADQAEVVTISHYHFDHHTPSYQDWLVNWTEKVETARQIYRNKRVLIKNPRENINPSQRQRAWLFQKTGGKQAKTLEPADNKDFTFGKTVLRFSEPVPHGADNISTGWVIMVLVECEDERFVFAPDVQGPMSEKTLQLIKTAKPHLLMVGGPPFYLCDFKVSEAQLMMGLNNLGSLAETVPTIILEHHALRDETWQNRIKGIRENVMKKGHCLMTAAEFIGQENAFMEASRKQLYLNDPPSIEFEKWMHEGLTANNIPKPPI